MNENIQQSLKSKSAPYIKFVFQKKESTQSHENESFLKRIFSCFKVTSKWNISIFMPAHLLREQTWENLNLPSLKHSWFLWRRRCALHCEGTSVRVCRKTTNSFSPPKPAYMAAEAPAQCLQSERARRVKHPLQMLFIKKVKQRCSMIFTL